MHLTLPCTSAGPAKEEGEDGHSRQAPGGCAARAKGRLSPGRRPWSRRRSGVLSSAWQNHENLSTSLDSTPELPAAYHLQALCEHKHGNDLHARCLYTDMNC